MKNPGKRGLTRDRLEALQRDEEQPGFLQTAWDELQFRDPARASYLEQRLSQIYGADSVGRNRALTVVLEFEALGQQSSFAAEMHAALPGAPRGLGGLSIAEQVALLEIDYPEESSSQAA